MLCCRYIEGSTARRAFWWLRKQPGGADRVTQVANTVTHQLAQVPRLPPHPSLLLMTALCCILLTSLPACITVVGRLWGSAVV